MPDDTHRQSAQPSDHKPGENRPGGSPKPGPKQERTRRLVFQILVGITLLIAIWVAIAQPFFTEGQADRALVAVIAPPLLFLAVVLGLIWLAWFVTKKR